MAKVDDYAVLPFGICVRNDFGGLESYDVSSLCDPQGWREGFDLNSFEGEDQPADVKFIAEATATTCAYLDMAVRHFASVGAVALPPGGGTNIQHNMAIVVPVADAERAKQIAYPACPVPPRGKLHHLVIDAHPDWMSLDLTTLSRLFEEARNAASSEYNLQSPFSDRLPSPDDDIEAWAERVSPARRPNGWVPSIFLAAAAGT